MADIGTLTNYAGGTKLYASQLNSDFGAIRTVVNSAVVHTDKASQVITKTLTFTPDSGNGFIVSTGGATITAGGLTITAGGLTITAGGMTTTGNASIVGTLTGLTGITSSGTAAFANVTASGTLGVTGASTLGVVGAGALTCTDLTVSGGSTVSITGASGSALTMSGGNASLVTPSGNLTLGAATVSSGATAGFPLIPQIATGAPTGGVGNGAVVIASSSNRVYFRINSTWRYIDTT